MRNVFRKVVVFFNAAAFKVLEYKEKVIAFIFTYMVFMFQTMGVQAADTSFLTDGSSRNAAVDNVTKQVKGVGTSIYMLLLVIGIIGIVCSLVVTGFSIAIHKNSQKREENKSHLFWIGVGGVVVFGAIAIVGIIQAAAATLGTS